MNIFRDSVDVFGLTFFPDNESEFYYVDPSDRDRYIALDDYFNYLKVERINELQKIAQDLGAKHFRVTYVEEKSSYTDKKIKGNGNAVNTVSVEAEHRSSAEKYSKIEIAAENDFPGKEPIKPQLKYLLRDSSIQNLITMRLDNDSALTHQRLMIKLSNSSGLKESDFGSRLDTVADFVFIVASLVKLVPALDIPTWIYIWVGVIAVIKIINVVSGFIVQKRFVAVHSVMNKVTGLLLFILPLTVSIIDLKYGGVFVCALATFSAIQEGHYIRTNRE